MGVCSGTPNCDSLLSRLRTPGKQVSIAWATKSTIVKGALGNFGGVRRRGLEGVLDTCSTASQHAVSRPHTNIRLVQYREAIERLWYSLSPIYAVSISWAGVALIVVLVNYSLQGCNRGSTPHLSACVSKPTSTTNLKGCVVCV